MGMQEILDEIESLQALPDPFTVTAVTEPTQAEWETAWLAAGNSLPIPVGTELSWHDGTQNRALYMTAADKLTIINHAEVIHATDVQGLRIMGWFDDHHLYGFGYWDSTIGTYKVYLDGSVEFICSEVAIIHHREARTFLVQDTGTNDIKLYNYETDTLSAAIDTVAWTFDNDSDPIFPASWEDPSDSGNLKLYYLDANEVHYWNAVSESTLFTVSAAATYGLSFILYTNSRIFLEFCEYRGVSTDRMVAGVYNSSGTELVNLYTTADYVRDWVDRVYIKWRVNRDDATLVDIAFPQTEIITADDLGQGYDADPHYKYEPYTYGRYREQLMHTGGNAPEYLSQRMAVPSWEYYQQYDTATDTLSTTIIEDESLYDLKQLGKELNVLDSDYWMEVKVDRHRWAGTLVSNREHEFPILELNPAGSLVFVRWYRTFGGNNQGVVRNGAFVVSSNTDNSTGRIFRISELVQPQADQIRIGYGVMNSAATIITFSNLDLIPEDYGILKLDLRINTAAASGNYIKVRVKRSGGSNYTMKGYVRLTNGAGTETGTDSATLGWGATSETPILAGGDWSTGQLTFYDIKPDGQHPLAFLGRGHYWDATGYAAWYAYGYADAADIGSQIGSIELEATGTTFETGAFAVLSALRTKAGYSKEYYNDYRMA